jgi:DnaK suppressor protein
MTVKKISKLRAALLDSKRDIEQQITHLEESRKAQEESEIETGDAAQKEDLIRLLDHFFGRGKEEIKEIDRALERMATGNYGICEICGRRIEPKRLNVLPQTRLCRSCAQKFEKSQELLQHPRDEIIADELLEAFRDLKDLISTTESK